MKKGIIYVLLAFLTSAAFGQFDDRSLLSNQRLPGINPDSYLSKPVQMIDMPTASILRGGDIKTSIRLFEQGGAIGRLSVGISNRMMFGVSFGGVNIIGDQIVKWNDNPGIHFMYRLMEETLAMPALVLGFDSQGYGPFWKGVPSQTFPEEGDPALISDRYANKSRGVFAVASKGYNSLIKFGMHGGINYSLEDGDGDKDPNLFLAIDALISRDIALLFEYDFATNDDEVRGANNNTGYFNAGVRWAFTDYMFIEFDFKNLLVKDNETNVEPKRILKFVYYGTIK